MDVSVWFMRPERAVPPTSLGSAFPLNPDEIARANRFVFPEDRAAFIATRTLLRVLLGTSLDRDPAAIVLVDGPNGKPRMEDPGSRVHFNVSHTRTLVAVALTDADVGVDVEAVRPAPTDVAAFLAAPEVTALAAIAQDDARNHAFFAHWTLKESYIKARGDGLAYGLDRFAVSIDPPRLLPFGASSDEAGDWSFMLKAPLGDAHLIAACVHAPRATWAITEVPADALLDQRAWRDLLTLRPGHRA